MRMRKRTMEREDPGPKGMGGADGGEGENRRSITFTSETKICVKVCVNQV
jgi:hypothetical protein